MGLAFGSRLFMSTLDSPKNGYELAQALFHECGGKNIDELIDFAGGETDWLEFKAGLFSRPQDLKDGENQDDALLHVARAVFGFLNSSGGMIVIGIDDKKKQPVDSVLGAKGELLSSMDADEALRKVEDQLPPSKCRWNTGKKGMWLWNKASDPIPRDSVSFVSASFRGRAVILVFVRPIGKGKGVFWTRANNRIELMIRRAGGRGRLESLTTPHDYLDWINRERQAARSEFSATFEEFQRLRKAKIIAKRVGMRSRSETRPSARKSPRPIAAADRLLCPNCEKYIAVPPRDGNVKCPDCGEPYYCGVHQPYFVPQTDNDSDGWAVAKWLLLSFDRWNPRRESDASLRENLGLNVRKVLFPGVAPDDFQAVLEQHALSVDENDEETDPLNGRDPWMCRAFSNGKKIAIRYSRSRLDRNWYWIGIERADRRIRVMDPRHASGYMSLADWRDMYGSDISKWGEVFAVSASH